MNRACLPWNVTKAFSTVGLHKVTLETVSQVFVHAFDEFVETIGHKPAIPVEWGWSRHAETDIPSSNWKPSTTLELFTRYIAR